MRKMITVSGVLAPVLYIAAVVLGGALHPGYDHVSRFVSELLEAGAPNKGLLNPLFSLYNLMCLWFGLALFAVSRGAASPLRSAGMAGALVLVLEGVLGLVTLVFPQDPVGAPVTVTGTLHIVLAGLSSLATMAGMLLVGLWLRALPAARRLGTWSIASLLFVFLSGGAAAAAAAFGSHVPGLLERLTIGGFLQWLVVIAAALPAERTREPAAPE